MVVAVVAVRMMKAAIHDVIDVIAVRDRLVPATGSVHVTVAMTDVLDPLAAIGVLRRHRQDMLVHRSVGVGVVEMTVVEKIDMVPMLDRRVAAAGSVLMLMVFLANVSVVHGPPP